MQTTLQSNQAAAERVGSYRWRICALLFFATAINYIDRQVFGLLAPELQRELGWTEQQYGYIIASFQGAYAVGFLLMGWLLDRFGARVVYAGAVAFWSVAAMAHGLARSVMGFGIARAALGLGEAGNFPGALKVVAEWFPQKERALATGLFNSGSNIGAVLAPILVPLIALQMGWQWAFYLTGALGVIWLVLWWVTYRRPDAHPQLGAAERAFIQSDPPSPTVRVPWARLVGYRAAWAFAIGKFLTDPIWWLYLYWLPKYLNTAHGLSIAEFGAPLVVIYLISDAGSIVGGWASSRLLARGWSVNRARKAVMLGCALAVTPIVFTAFTSDLWTNVLLIALAAAAHQAWSANLFTLTTDLFPRQAVGSVVGFGGTWGALGGMLIATITGWVLAATGSYVPMFVFAGVGYLLALGLIQLLVPRIAPVALAEGA